MFNFGMALLIVRGFALISPVGAADAAQAGQNLFNGKSLEGWRYYLADHTVGLEDVWSVRDGVLVCKGEPMGYLYTKKAYRNFKLRLEWRWAGEKGGNSGVLMRIQGAPRPLPRCHEAQLQSGKAGEIFGLQGLPVRGPEDRFRTIKNHELGGDILAVGRLVTDAEKPAGEWNTYQITVNGPKISVSINGKLVNEATDAEVVAGPIGLQSEGGEVHFRNIVLTPLAD